MKRFLRWLLPIICIILFVTWGYKVDWRFLRFTYSNDEGTERSLVLFRGIEITHRMDEMIDAPPSANKAGIHIHFAPIPLFWILFTPLILLTLVIWYHPLKARWRGENRKGFEVELKDKNESPHLDPRVNDSSHEYMGEGVRN